MTFIKLSSVPQFTVKEYKGCAFKCWDAQNRKMLKSDFWQEGYRKMHTIETVEGTLDVSSSQLGSMFEAFNENGNSSIIGKTFTVKTNGQTGLNIRYFLNGVYGKAKPAVKEVQNDVSPEEIPFN